MIFKVACANKVMKMEAVTMVVLAVVMIEVKVVLVEVKVVVVEVEVELVVVVVVEEVETDVVVEDIVQGLQGKGRQCHLKTLMMVLQELKKFIKGSSPLLVKVAFERILEASFISCC